MSFRKKENLLDLEVYWVKHSSMIYHVGASTAAIAIYGFLASVPEPHHPSEEKIAEALGISPNTVSRALKELVAELGVLTVSKVPVTQPKEGELNKKGEQKRMKCRNAYTFQAVEQWKKKPSPSWWKPATPVSPLDPPKD